MHLFILWDWSEWKGKKFSPADILWHILKTFLFWWLGKLWCPGRTKKIAHIFWSSRDIYVLHLDCPSSSSVYYWSWAWQFLRWWSWRLMMSYCWILMRELNKLSRWSTSPPWVISSSRDNGQKWALSYIISYIIYQL